VGRDLALAQERREARDVLARFTQSCRVVKLTGRQLESQVEQLTACLGQALNQFIVTEETELSDSFFRLSH
jgi:hypothetical protein